MTPDYRRVTLFLPSHPAAPRMRLTTKLTHQAQQVSGETGALGTALRNTKRKSILLLQLVSMLSVCCLIILYVYDYKEKSIAGSFCLSECPVRVCFGLRSNSLIHRFKISPDHPCHRTSLYSFLLSFLEYSRHWNRIWSLGNDYEIVRLFY